MAASVRTTQHESAEPRHVAALGQACRAEATRNAMRAQTSAATRNSTPTLRIPSTPATVNDPAARNSNCARRAGVTAAAIDAATATASETYNTTVNALIARLSHGWPPHRLGKLPITAGLAQSAEHLSCKALLNQPFPLASALALWAAQQPAQQGRHKYTAEPTRRISSDGRATAL